MRPIETLLLIANLLTFFVLAVLPFREIRWTGYAALTALTIALGQLLVEGYRWQMIPAYLLTALFFIVCLQQKIAPSKRTRCATNRTAVGLAIGLTAIALAISIALPIVLPVFRFPRPSGSYEIGTLTYHWVDANRPEVFSADPNVHRELMVQIWYPAKRKSSSPSAPYIQDAKVVAPALARLFHLPEFTFDHLKYVVTNAIPSASISGDQPNYPVLIFLEGLTGFRQMNTFQVEELVSHGYIVAGVDQPYVAASVVLPDGHQVVGQSKEQMNVLIQQSISPVDKIPLMNGRGFKDGIIPYLAQDVSFTLDSLTALNQADPNDILTGRMDLQHIGIFGVSLGGIVVGEACRIEPRLQACLVMDAPMSAEVVKAGLSQPTMWITRDVETMRLERQRSGGWSEADINQHQQTMRAVFESLPRDGYFVRVLGIFHANLMDIPYWSPLFPFMGITGAIDQQRSHNIINAYSLAFFDKHLKGRSSPLLDQSAKPYPEVLFETPHP
jgi:predicted dienelactone hydrolase